MNILWDDETLVRHTILDSKDELAVELANRLERQMTWEHELYKDTNCEGMWEITEKIEQHEEMEGQLEELNDRLSKFITKHTDYTVGTDDIEEGLDTLFDAYLDLKSDEA